MNKFLYVILVLSLFSRSASAELLLYYNFDGNIKDSCSSKCEPNIYGGIKFADGVSGQCLDLSGPGDNAVILNGSENVANGLNTFTICFWYKGKLKDNVPWASLVSKNGEDNEGWQIRFYNQEGGGCFTVGGIKDFKGNCSGSAQIGDGKWHHIAGVLDGKFVYFYVDGILEDVVDAPGKPQVTDSPIVIGGKIVKGGKEPQSFSRGMIDELRIYDEALSQKTIKELSSYDRVIGLGFTETYKQLGVYPIQAHRGGGVLLPEHTMETYKQTWERHAIPEADIRTTKDDVIVCFHDTNLKRICPNLPGAMRKKGIGAMTFEEVKELDVGASRGKPGEKVPTLDEVFKEMSGRPERFIYLDYKYIDMQQLADMVKKYGIEKQLIFANRSHHLIMQWKRLMPQSQAMLWTGGSQQSIAQKLESLRLENFQGITMIQFHYVKDGNDFNLSDDFILKEKKELEQRGIILQILPWKINDTAVFEKLIGLGIKSFATDYPDALLPVYEQKLKIGQ